MGRFLNDDVESAQFLRDYSWGHFCALLDVFDVKRYMQKAWKRSKRNKKDASKKNWRAREKASSRLSFRDGPRGPQLWGPGRARARARALSTPAHTGNSKFSRVTFKTIKTKNLQLVESCNCAKSRRNPC